MTQSAPRVMIVVARSRPDLFVYLERVFAGMTEVSVVFDRRIADPQPRGEGTKELRERASDVYDELDERGFIAIRLW